MKTEFELKFRGTPKPKIVIFKKNTFNPKVFVKIYSPLQEQMYLSGKDLRLFAVNILKALKSKRLKK